MIVLRTSDNVCTESDTIAAECANNPANSLKANKITYPDAATLANMEVFLNLPDETNRKIDDLWTEIRGSSSGNVWLFPTIAAALVVVCVIIIVARRTRKKAKY